MTDKGEPNRPKVRCRLRAKTKGILLVHELFSAMLLWESFRVLLEFSSAMLFALVDREVIELPQEDHLPEDGDAAGFFFRSMYGFRTARANRQREWQSTLEQTGYKVGVANLVLFYNAEERCRGGFYGGEFGWLVSSIGLDG